MANWFAYNNVGDPSIPGSYTRMFTKPTCITGGCKICAIYLDDNSTTAPSSITAILPYLGTALGTLLSQPTGLVKRFIYVKQC